MKKLVFVFSFIFLFSSLSFAFDPYEDEEVEKKSKTKLYCGIAMTLVGAFLAYDGFSQEEVDISRPSVDYGGVIESSWVSNEESSPYKYTLRSGVDRSTTVETDTFQQNVLYNNGNVDLYNVNIYVRYRYNNEEFIDEYTDTLGNVAEVDDDYYRHAMVNRDSQRYEFSNLSLEENKSLNWVDVALADTAGTNPPYGTDGVDYFQENALKLVDVKVTYDYKKKYKKQNKSDIEGVAGIIVATAGIYFIVDYLVDLHKFNQYMQRNDMNVRLAKTPNEYKLLFQKRL